MSISKYTQELLHSLEQVEPARELNIGVMPDFFLDRLITYKGNAKQLYNAVAEVARRKGGSLHDEVTAELISDGVHVHPAAMKLLTRVKSSNRVILVTDAIRAAGMPDGEYKLGNKMLS